MLTVLIIKQCLCKRLLNRLKSKTTHELIQHSCSWKVFCLRPSPNNITAFCSENSFYTFFARILWVILNFPQREQRLMYSQSGSSQKVFIEVFLTPEHEIIYIILLHFYFFCFRQLFESLPFTPLLSLSTMSQWWPIRFPVLLSFVFTLLTKIADSVLLNMFSMSMTL